MSLAYIAIKSRILSSVHAGQANQISAVSGRQRKMKKAEKTLGLLILTFFLRWTPFLIYWIVGTFDYFTRDFKGLNEDCDGRGLHSYLAY